MYFGSRVRAAAIGRRELSLNGRSVGVLRRERLRENWWLVGKNLRELEGDVPNSEEGEDAQDDDDDPGDVAIV